MGQLIKSLYLKGDVIDNAYEVDAILSVTSAAQVFRVINKNSQLLALKIGQHCKYEYELLKSVESNGLVDVQGLGAIRVEDLNNPYYTSSYISGEPLSNRLERRKGFSLGIALQLLSPIVEALIKLHEHSQHFVHGNITPQNIMIDMSAKRESSILLGLSSIFTREQLAESCLSEKMQHLYSSPEQLDGNQPSFTSDLYSLCAVFYAALTGEAPFSVNTDDSTSISIKKKEEGILSRVGENGIIPKDVFQVLRKGLASDPNNRHSTIRMFKDSLELCNSVKKIKNTKLVSRSKVDSESNTVPASGKPIGFNAIAGMGKLKSLLQRDVIDALKEPELYESYGLNIPNGMLLYGPPGCGKTFFAEKLAEEVGFKFYQLKPSDIQSQWVNESQQNVKAIFEDAVNNSPSILFVDELDAVVPKRDGNNVSHMNTSVVNEFLAQMNNLGEQGVFVIGATNHPDGIDSAVLRSGRLDKKILIPPPDAESRMAMLKLILSSRPVSSGLDYQSLADATEGYVASDIKLICDDASRVALAQREVISMEMLLHSIKENPSSLAN